MNIYLIERTERIHYDEYDAHVIVAPNSTAARKLAAAQCPDWSSSSQSFPENSDAWLNTNRSKVRKIGESTANKPIIVLSSFNAG